MISKDTRVIATCVLGLLLVVLLLGANAVGQTGNPASPYVFPPNAKPYGMTYGEWTALYWKSVMENPYDPVSFSWGQEGRVAFLAATAGGPGGFAGTVRPGTTLMFPVISTAAWCPLDCGPGSIAPNGTVEELTAWVQADVDTITVIEADIDGVPVSNPWAYRILTPVFYGIADDNNLWNYFGLTMTGPYGPAVADGYWLMVKPLPPGSHTIHFHAVKGDPHNPIWETESWHIITVLPKGSR